ncbi:MAG: hypothetical protein U5N86_05075 [Planctomycetota bacterium]|nr:hypothetical protein [Planctomycetota bacterium]
MKMRKQVPLYSTFDGKRAGMIRLDIEPLFIFMTSPDKVNIGYPDGIKEVELK